MASHLAAARDVGDAVTETWWDRLRGLVFLGYPLHPPGKPQQVRVSHLPHIIHPMLAVQGAKRWPELPILMMTAFHYDKDHIIKRSRLEGLEGVIFKKPVNPERLIKTLAEIVTRVRPALSSR